VGEPQLAREPDLVARSDADCGGRPLPDAVEREDRCLGERAWEERARGMALVMAGKGERRLHATVPDSCPDDLLEVRLLFQPDWQRHAEALQAVGRVGEVGLEQAIDLP
jgi:hypothetical protein